MCPHQILEEKHKKLYIEVREAPHQWLFLWTNLLEFLRSVQKAAKEETTSTQGT